ncbi:dihydrolipoyl dehydrogenase [Puniceicoccales bacterium CK1056]|uniref:Dihydrolipoyl dehydrogenase n=1 Tax=Oceanipulchritudo coccoides TaxID=2706888 RepID=A0A6B2LX61_9BACT|nr:dihydrolipoyl dehydrogenase [Oceanipulchritudo coccoides]NDV61158.1 dihydrolipoyl dehydrogenase [Oceanipulchritudo coccoides]
MSKNSFDVVIVGSGPGGYVCAIRCAQLGLSTAIVEKDPHLGGTCLNVGCIPSKALLHSTELYHQAAHGEAHGLVIDKLAINVAKLMERKGKVVDQLRKGVETLVKKREITVHKGTGSFVSKNEINVHPDDGTPTRVMGKNIVIATGSVPVSLPFMQPDGKQIVTSTEAIAFESVPKSLLVIGAGAIGLELGSVWSRLGSEVTFLEFLPTIAAGSDTDISKLAERAFKKQGMKFHTGTKVTGCKQLKTKVVVTAEKKGKEIKFEAEKVLLSVGRKPHTQGLGLEKIGLSTDEKGRIPVDSFRTGINNIWAIGDVIEGPMLAHKAEEDGVAVAEAIAGRKAHVDYSRVPNVIYTEPEVASVGLTEQQASDRGIDFKTGKFPLLANGRAIAQDATDGVAKIITDAKTDRIIGAAIMASGASEIIASIVAHMEYGGSAEDLAGTVHAHPTISESLKEAALAVQGRAIHSL